MYSSAQQQQPAVDLRSVLCYCHQDELSAAAYLEYDDYSNAKSALDAAQQVRTTVAAALSRIADHHDGQHSIAQNV